MKIGMNGAEIAEFVEQLKAGENLEQLERRSRVDPAWFELNRASLLKMAGLEALAEEAAVDETGGEQAEAPTKRGKRKG